MNFFGGKTVQLLHKCGSFTRNIHTSVALHKVQAGRYRVTRDRSKPVTYEQAIWAEDIAIKKGFNSHNTGQLEETFLRKEEMGQDLPYKLLIEDMFIRKFMHGTFPEFIESEVIVKRQHNLVRIACLINRKVAAKKIYFLIGYTEEFLSFYLKCPVKLELQSVGSEADTIYRYV